MEISKGLFIDQRPIKGGRIHGVLTGIVCERGRGSMKPHTGARNLAYGSFESTCTSNLS